MEEQENGYARDSDCSDTSETAGTEHWDGRWIPSETYNSARTSNYDHEQDEFTNINCLKCHAHKSNSFFYQNCPLGYSKMIGLRGSVPNLTSTTYNMSLCSNQHNSQENIKEQKGNESYQSFESGTERRFRNRINCEQQFRSHTDLFLRRKEFSNCCSSQYFQIFREREEYLAKIEERLRKLEDERGALQMEVLVLSERVKAKSNKIQKLERLLRKHEDSWRRLDEALQIGEKFERHTSQYRSLPRLVSSSKKGVVFAEEEKNVIIESLNCRLQAIEQKPLTELSMEEIGEWLTNLGLECYAGELKQWGATGAKLFECSPQQIEKELEIKDVLHKKKLLYAIESEKSDGADFLGSDKMDNAAVLRWLDDIGLPQHKEAFQNGKVDGRMLHRLTTEDLLNLGVNAQLHAASLRRGIQVLRGLNFEFDNLERRSTSGNGADGGNVHLWTNHRVMEWLRVVDLAEYAPNMRGSGVHGGLMVYEGRFTSELMAALLSISPGKTLLRRHLTTHFNQILGREVVQRKREIENTLGFVPLTLTARLKIPKKSQFTLKRKKSKNEVDYGNLVCPLEESPPGTPSTPVSTPSSPNLNSPVF